MLRRRTFADLPQRATESVIRKSLSPVVMNWVYVAQIRVSAKKSEKTEYPLPSD